MVGTTFTWNGFDANDSVADPLNWVDSEGDPGVPGTADTAEIDIGATLIGDLDVQALLVTGQVLYEGGKHTGALPGQVLRS